MDAFGREALDSHNRYRAQHGAGSLTWSSSMAREAETWARGLAREGRLKHADSDDGENIYMCFGKGDVSGADAVDSWYSEVKEYRFNKPGFQSNTGHFTQVVWNGSREFGIGKAKSPDGKLFVVGRYRPAGNNLRYFTDNVFSKGGAPPRGSAVGKEDRGTRRPEPTRSCDINDHGRTFQPITQNASVGRPAQSAFAPIKGSKGTAQDDDDEFDRYRRMFETDAEQQQPPPDAPTRAGGTYQVKESITTEQGPGGQPRRSYVREVERRYDPSSQRGMAPTRGDDKFDRYRKKFDNASHEDSSSSPGARNRNSLEREDRGTKQYGNRSPLGGEDSGTKQYVTRTRREDGGYEEKTETVTKTADGGKRTVVSTVTVSVNQGGSGGTGQRNWKPTSTTTRDSSPLSDFSQDMRRDMPNDDKRHGPRSQSQPKSVSPRAASGIPVKTSGSSKPQDFPKQALQAHNRYRAAHGVPSLKWSDQMAREAQTWAEKLANERCLRHASKSEREDCGENIAMFTGKFDEAGDEATTMWYDEVENYNFRRSGFQSNTGHFTQVVWRDSKELGMGRASTRDGRLTFVVGRYRPAGNVMGHFDNNVYPRAR